MFTEAIRQDIENFLHTKVRSSLNEEMCYMWYENEYDDCGDEDFSGVCFACGADRYANGVSKITLFYNDLVDWVIKVPILGNYYEEEDDYRDYDQSGAIRENDYCLAELDYCEEALHQNIGQCFAKTYYVCNINGINFYCSEKVDIVYHDKYHYGDTVTYTKPHSYAQAKHLLACYDSYLAVEELALFVDAYGEQTTQQLIKFLYEWDIADLHHGNLGFDTNNNIKIIDCAGWRD